MFSTASIPSVLGPVSLCYTPIGIGFSVKCCAIANSPFQGLTHEDNFIKDMNNAVIGFNVSGDNGGIFHLKGTR